MLIALPVAAAFELQALSGSEARLEQAAVQLQALRSQVNQAAANAGWDIALHAPAAGVVSELSVLRSDINQGLTALRTNPVDAAGVAAITSSANALMSAMSGAVSSPTPGAAISLVQQHSRLVGLVDAYAAKLEAAAATASSMFSASVWAVVLSESALLGGALWYGLAHRRRAAVAVAKQESLLQLEAVVDNAPVVAYAVDADGVLTFLEGRALELAGVRKEDLIGHSMAELFGDRDDVMSAMRSVFAGELLQTQLELYGRTWDIRGNVVGPADGSRHRVVGVAHDVTALVASQEALRRREAELRDANRKTAETLTLLETLQSRAPVGFAFLDRDFRFVRINDTMASINGLPPSQHIGRAVKDLAPAELWPTLEQSYRQVIESGEAVVNIELSWNSPSDPGRRHHSLNSYYPVRVGDEVVGIGVVLVDITERKEAAERLAASEAAVRNSEARFRALVQNSSDAVMVLDSQHRLTYASPACQTMVGRPMSAEPLDDIVEEDRERVAATLAVVARHPGTTGRLQLRLRCSGGGVKEVESVLFNALDIPAINGIIVNTRDVSEASQANDLLATQARILTMIASGAALRETLTAITAEVKEHLPEVRSTIQLLGVDGTLEVSAAVSRDALACTRMEGQPVSDHSICGTALLRDKSMLVDEPAASARWGWSPCLSPPNEVRKCWVTPIRRDPNGAPVGVLTCYFPHSYEPDDHARQTVQTACELAAVAIDRKRFEDQLSHQSLHDQLTGLPNRALLLEQLRGDVARAERKATTGAVLVIDLDRLKIVNDSLGHASGDHVLREMARRITAEVRSEDTVARLAGDEFAVSCPDIHDDEESVRLAQRLLRAIGKPLTVRSQEVRLTASIGIAIRHAGDTRVDTLLRNADVALYRAKERGRDRWEMFDASQRKRAVQRLRTETALRKAVEAGDFEVWYQPVWSVSRQTVRSVEALVRWPRPGGELASPATFIPLAEETGLISKLGAWVLRQAVADAALLDRDGTHLPHMAVNASARQLTDGSLIPAVEAALAAAGWDASRLTVEVTESAIVGDPGAALRTLKALRALNVTVALDDFGTGFSSMSYLKNFPYVSAIKIDRSFVSGVADRNSTDHAIVRATIALAEAVGATVVAEGVETAEQFQALVSLGCDRIQGYLVARPMPMDELRVALIEQPWRTTLQAAEPMPRFLQVLPAG